MGPSGLSMELLLMMITDRRSRFDSHWGKLFSFPI